LQANLAASISDQRLSLAASNITVTDAGGSGELLLRAGDWVTSSFTDDLIEFSELTINYDRLTLRTTRWPTWRPSRSGLDLNGQGLSLFLNIDAIVDAE